jgi:lysophospholipase L1-like esterase
MSKRFLVALALLASCTSTPTTTSTMTAPATNTKARYLALGDSYTIGESVGAAENFPALLARELQIADPEIIAKTGWTTAELSAGIDTAMPKGPYDLVTLLIGVNNQYRGLNEEEYREEFTKLLWRAVAFAGGNPRKVVVVSIPDWGRTPFAAERDTPHISADIDTFNSINREETSNVHARYVDITEISRGTDAALVAADGLHPSPKQYAEWVKLILPEARAALAKTAAN